MQGQERVNIAFRRLRVWIKFQVLGVFLCGMPLSTLAFSPEYSIDFENDLYRTTVKPSEFPILGAGIQFSSENDESLAETEYEYRGDFKIRMSPTHPKAFTFSSRNLYWGEKDQSYESPLRFTYGRRLIGWTKLDEMWGLGAFEPLNSWDRLRSFSQGLTGIFAYTETQVLNFRFFLSYLSIPESTPNVVIEKNHFLTEHPQATSSAPQTIDLFGTNKPTPIGYELDIPNISKVIFRPSIVFMVETKREIPLQFKFVYGYLPLNYLPVALDGSYSLNSSTVPARLSPRLLSHNLYNLEASYRFNDHLSAGAVNLLDQPNSENIPSNLITTPLTTSNTLSPWIQYELNRFKLTISQIWTTGGLDADTNTTPGPSIFSSRMLYRNATSGSLQSELGNTNPHHPILQLKYVHEYSINGDWIAADFYYSLKPNLTLFVGGDLIGATRRASPDRGAEFLADLRTNDRVRFGANYVF